MSFRLVRELAAAGTPVAVACRVLRVSISGYYEWRDRPPSERAAADKTLSTQIVEIHVLSRGTYGVPPSMPSSGSVAASAVVASGWRG